MRIKCLTTFLDGPRRFEAGDLVTVPDEDAARFFAHGWACEPGKEPAQAAQAAQAGSMDLEVQGSTMGQTAAIGEN